MQASSSTLPSYTPPSKDVISVVPSLSALHPDPQHPAHHALLANLDFKKDSVRIFSFSQGGIVLCPEEVGTGSRTAIEEEESWAKVGGYLQVISTSKKTVPLISVKIVGLQSLAFPGQDRVEVDEVFCKEVVLSDVQLSKGLNTFEFLLAIPHDAPPHEDSSFASLKHRAVGTVVGGAKGIFGAKDLVAEEVAWVAAAPSTSSDPQSLSLNVHVEGLIEAFGPLSLDVSSSLFIVGGPISISLTLHSSPPSLKVYALKCYIDQKIDLTSFRFPATRKATVLRTGMVLEEGWSGPYGSKSLTQLLKDGRAGEEILFDASVGLDEGGSGSWTFEKVARIPSDRVLRPSTHPNTKSCIRVTSELVVDLYFTSSEPSSPPNKVLIATVLRRPVYLASCGCLSSRLSLPDYTQTSNKFVPITVSVPCKCDEPSEKLLADEMEYVRASRAAHASSSSAGERLDPEASVLLGRKIGEAY